MHRSYRFDRTSGRLCRLVLFTAFITLAITGPTQAATLLRTVVDRGELEAVADQTMAAEMKEQEIPGAVFIFVQNGRVVLEKGYGLADVARSKPVDPRTTIFPIASITKVFTGTALVQLADRGKLDLNADVNRYLKTIRVPAGKPVTARHLLTHTAGFDELRGRLITSTDERPQPLDRFLATRLVRVRPPGELTSYSSFGTALAGLLVEDVSELPYERYLAAHVWAPLKMNRTQVTVPEVLLDDLAVPYELIDKKIVAIPHERYHTTPAGSISATASDMGRYMLAILGGGTLDGARILSDAATRDMITQQITMHPQIPGFGYVWQMSATNGQRIVEHGGNVGGFHSLMVLLPDHNAGFFVAAHREGADLRSPLRRAILNRWFANQDPNPPLPVANREAVPGLKKKYEGTYRWTAWCHTCPFDADRVFDAKVSVNDDGSLQMFGERWIEVSPLYFRSADGRGVGFREDANGNITSLTRGSFMVLERLREGTP
jgi:CubicO group peptidase (beta-lactamase class C family)